MKIRLLVSEKHYESLRLKLEQAGFSVDDEAPFVLSEAGEWPDFLGVRNRVGDKLRIRTDSIIFIESYGHNVEIHTPEGVYASRDRLYQLAAFLDPGAFIRISQSVIIARKHVKKIRPSLSKKFVLTLSDGTLVDVTRSYYSAFREFFGI